MCVCVYERAGVCVWGGGGGILAMMVVMIKVTDSGHAVSSERFEFLAVVFGFVTLYGRREESGSQNWS